MSENKTFIGRLPIFAQLLFLIALVILFSGIFLVLGMALIKPLYGIIGADDFFLKVQNSPDSMKNDYNAINALKFIQLLSSFGLLVPAIVFASLKKMPGDYLKVTSLFKPLLAVLAIFILFTSGPLINVLYEWNQQMKLPSFLKGVEHFMRSSEDTDARLTTLFLIMPHFSDFIYNLVLIGLLPAIAEEFLFRGVLQQLLKESFKNAHVAIWVTAIIFSAIHVQFYGFIPRMVLGAILGYLFYWSGNIWVPVIGHFINNGGQVIMDYLHRTGAITYDVESDQLLPLYITFTATVLLAGFLYFFYKNRVPEPVEMNKPDEPDSINPTFNNNQWQ